MDDQGPCVVETAGARNIRYRGRLLYSERGPALIPRKAALACELGPARLYLVFSPGLWYGVPELLARIEQGSAILCVEADPRLAALSRTAAPPELLADGRIAFVESADPEKLRVIACGLGAFRRVIPLRLSGGEVFHAEAYRRAAALLQAEFAADWRNRASFLALGRLWARNSFKNLAAMGELKPLPLVAFPRPALVAGAGPSLEAALPFILRERDRLYLVAVDTALPSLLAAQIEPDLVVCLEAQTHNLADFIPAGGRALPLLADLSSHPATFRALSGPRHLSMVRIARGGFARRLGELALPALAVPPLGSVGVHALHIARRLSPAYVLVTGLDFAYELGKTHARSAPALGAEERRMNRLYRANGQIAAAFKEGARPAPEAEHMPPSAAQGRARTDPVLASYAALLAEECAAPGPLVLDLRGRGLSIGARSTSFAEAAAALAAFDAERHRSDRITAEAREGGREAGPQAAERAAGFIAEERGRLENIHAAMKGRGSLSREGFSSLVLDSDYLLWPFPDAERFRLLPQDLLNRLLVEVEYWRWKLADIASGAGL